MTDFKTIWNTALKADDLPDLVAGIGATALNDILKVHRNKPKDRDFYQRKEAFKDEAGAALFTVEVIVGGDRAAQTGGTAKPLTIALGKPAPVAPADDGFAYPYATGRASGAPELDVPNAVITARDVCFYFGWPSSTGGPAWNTQLSGIEFRMDVHLSLVETADDAGKPTQALQVRPLKLRLSKASVAALRGEIARQNSDQKVQDLFFALLNYIALSVGPNLMRVVKFPVMAIEDFTILPMLLDIRSEAVTIGAKLNVAARLEQLAVRLDGLKANFWAEVEADRAEARTLGLEPGDTDYPRATQLIDAYREGLRAQRQSRDLSDAPGGTVDTATTRAPVADIGVLLNEFLLDTIVSKFGNIAREGHTDRVTLLLIRGRAGYELRIGAVDIDVTATGIAGTVPVDAFGGLYYQWKEVHGCSIEWGDEHRLGLGVRGKPGLKLRTRPTNGLSILADFDAGGLAFYTGAGGLIDQLVGDLTRPLFRLVEAVLDTMALAISFIVIPVTMKLPGQETTIKMAQFATGQYKHPQGGTGSRNNYAMFTTDITAS